MRSWIVVKSKNAFPRRHRLGQRMASSKQQKLTLDEPMIHDNRKLFTAIREGDQDETQKQKSALLILNNERNLSKAFIQRLWNKTERHICADGGANWLFDHFHGELIPDVVHGDLDSVRPEVQKFFTDKGSEVTPDRRDDATDMDKCLSRIRKWPNSENFLVFVAGIFGSRMVLVSVETVGEILPGGVEHVLYPDRLREGPICGMIPLFGPCKRVDTSGLRWNMDGRPSAFGGLVSTSNEIADDEVKIKSDGTLLWTTTLHFKDA